MIYRDVVMMDQPSLVGYWRLGDLAGATVAVDGKAMYNGTFKGGTVLGKQGITGCPYNQAVQFNGTDAYIQTPFMPLFSGGGPFTLEAWVRSDVAWPAGDAPIFSCGDASAQNKWVYCLLRSGVPYFGFYQNDTQATNALSVGAWHHVAFVFEGATTMVQRIYVDGAQVVSGVMGSAPAVLSGSATSGAWIGRYQSSYMNGLVDEVALYNAAIDAQTIQFHYIQGTTPPIGLPSDWFLSKFGDPATVHLSRVTRKVQKKPVRLGRNQVLAGGTKVRDITSIKRTVTISWDMLPHMDANTLDDAIGYYTLYQFYRYGINAGENNGELTLQMPDGKGGLASMNCYIGPSTKAKMTRQPSPNSPLNTVFWAVTLELIEV